MHLAKERGRTAATVPTPNLSPALVGGTATNPHKDQTMTSVITTTPPPAIDRAKFLERSTYDSDAGSLIGRDPRQVPLAEIRQLRHSESPIKAIRAKCVDCSGGNVAEARKCVAVNCPLWPMRMGVNPFHASSASAKLDMANFASASEGGAF